MQNTPNPSAAASTPKNPAWLTSYGPLILSFLVILIITLAWFLHDLDQTAALAFIGAILTGNGLVSATQWQAAPGLVSQLQAIIAQLTEHVQVLHAQQQASSVLKLPQAVRTSTPPPLTQFPGPRPGPGGSSGG